jgi:RHS repeat-associated protein
VVIAIRGRGRAGGRRGSRQAEVETCRHEVHAAAQPLDLLGPGVARLAVAGHWSCVAELIVEIITPRPDRPIRLAGNAVVHPARNGCDAAQRPATAWTDDLHGVVLSPRTPVPGDRHSLALKNDGTVWAWGYNAFGELGSNGNTSSSTPAQVEGPSGSGTLSGVTAVAARGFFNLALKNDGTVWAWGANNNGELGDNTETRQTPPVQVLGLGGSGVLSNITAITTNHDGSLAIKSDGSVWTWGLNDAGEAGTGVLGDNTTPVQVVGPGSGGTLSGITAIAGGVHHSIARKSDGTVWTWGDDLDNQLGYTAPVSCDGEPCSSRPQQVQGLGGSMNLVAAGFYFSLTAATSTTRTATTTYSYDHLYRLTGAAGPSGTTIYGYDPNGNRLSKVLSGQTTNYSYDKADRILTAGTTSYTVNTAGNLTNRGSDSFSYDQPNRLTSATTSTGSGTYVYDGDGKRISKTVGSTTTSYVYDVGGGLPIVLDDGSRKYVWGAAGLAYSVDKSTAAVQVYHTDGLGSVRAITDSTGSVVQAYQTDEFGIPTQTQGTSAQPFGFTGEQRDPEDGLVYLRARMYDPSIGRFFQRDPLAKSASGITGFNRYTYAGNNPVTLVDPSGLSAAQNRVLASGALQCAPGIACPPQVWPRTGIDQDSVSRFLRWLLAIGAAAGAGAVEDQGPTSIFYHGTDPASAIAFLNGAPLNAATATNQSLGGEPGFYLATDYWDAYYFGSLHAPFAVLQYSLTSRAVATLAAAGAVLRPIPRGAAPGPFNGLEFFIPPSAFAIFNTLRQGGQITVLPASTLLE